MYNVASITASEELKIEADLITHTEMPQGTQIDEGVRIMMAMSVDPKGNIRRSVAGSYHDGDFVISGGYFTAFKEGLDIISKGIDRLASLSDTKQRSETLKDEEQIQQKVEEFTDKLEDNKDDQAKEDRRKLLLAKKYYEDKGQKLPYEVSLAILGGLIR
jgi:hypothetical protein